MIKLNFKESLTVNNSTCKQSKYSLKNNPVFESIYETMVTGCGDHMVEVLLLVLY